MDMHTAYLPGEIHFTLPEDPDWRKFFSKVLWDEQKGLPATTNAEKLLRFLKEEYAGEEIYPGYQSVFSAFSKTPMKNVKVVILGQDPYHEPGQAQGLSFSVPNGMPIPPSLKNIFKEREADVGVPADFSRGDLSPWAAQGVLLLNTVLTVRRGEAGSHRKKGWEEFTDEVLKVLDARDCPMAFVLWGGDARKKKILLKNPKHLIIESEHPSPLSAWRGFFGSKPFSKINGYLREQGMVEISWEN